jgi:hypothetical protein
MKGSLFTLLLALLEDSSSRRSRVLTTASFKGNATDASTKKQPRLRSLQLQAKAAINRGSTLTHIRQFVANKKYSLPNLFIYTYMWCMLRFHKTNLSSSDLRSAGLYMLQTNKHKKT